MSKPIHKRTALLNRSFDGVSEMITGRIQGPWVVRAGSCDHCPDIKVIIFGGGWSRSGVNVGDRSVTLAGDDWRPLVAEAVTEMQRRTGRPLSLGCSQFFGVRDVNAGPDDPDDPEYLAFAKEAFDTLCELADAPAPAPGAQWASLIPAPVREHSRKPDEARRMIEAYYPTLPKIELFARGEARPGWDAWGMRLR